MNARSFYAFSTEIMKAAADVPEDPLDADLRELYADRRGDEKYLPGGQLPSNAIEDMGGRYAIKLGYMGPSAVDVASGSYDITSRKKKRNFYQKARDYGIAGLKGGAYGLALYGAHRTLTGQYGAPGNIHKAIRNSRYLAGGGAAASVADRAYRHDHLPLPGSGEAEKQAMVSPSLGHASLLGGIGKTPAKLNATASRVGRFEAGRIHTPRLRGFR
jgi:hypothetical protein